MKSFFVKIALLIFILIILSASVLSYWRLDRVPYGFHVDEMSGAVDIGCMATEGVDAHNVRYPLFSNLNYGTPKPPTFIYPGMFWARVFGYSVASIRALTVTVHLLGIVGLLFLARSLFGWRYAILTTALAILSPWTWGLSRVAFESLFSASFMIWGICLFLKPPKAWSVILSGLFFIAAVYSYPPFRLQIPLMLITLIVYARFKDPWPFKSWLLFACAFFLPSIPLIQKTMNGEIQQRFNTISIFSKDYLNSIHSNGHLTDIIGIFIHNFLLHFSADFLFLTGDPSYVHSTRHFGILSWMDMVALFSALIWVFLLISRKHRVDNPWGQHWPFILFLSVNILIGVLPAALTNSELPNSLRITGAWPFFCLLSGFFLWQACERFWPLWIAACALTICFAVVFFNIYFGVFPQEGKGMFGYWTLGQANQLKTDEDWTKFVIVYRYQDYNARYFLMQYRGLTCTQSRNVWEGMRDLLKARGMY